jgi:hypothetical protein
MDDLFRFVVLRPPQSADNNQTVSIALPYNEEQEIQARVALTAAFVSENPLARQEALMGTTNLQPQGIQSFFQAYLAAARAFPTVPERRYWMVYIAVQYVTTDVFKPDLFIRDLSTLVFREKFDQLHDRIAAADPHLNLLGLEQLISDIFGMGASQLLSSQDFSLEALRVFDSILAIFLIPLAHKPELTSFIRSTLLADLTRIAQATALIERVAAKDTTLNQPGAAQEALVRTVLLPSNIFPIDPDQIQPFNVGDLLVVKQHLKGYELGEISHIENILQGESKKHTTKHTLTTEQTFVTETEKITETTRDLQTTERFELKSEAENTIKEDISLKAGVAVSGKYGGIEFNTSTDFAYGNSKSQATKTATAHSKDVTSRAASKVTERVRQQQTTRILETFEETDEHGFNNTNGQGNVVGVYQWVNKVYEAQVFNYGNRLVYDIMIPEPAAFLLDAFTVQEEGEQLEPPLRFETEKAIEDPNNDNFKPRPITPNDLGEKPDEIGADGKKKYYYGDFLARYGVVGVEAPPHQYITVSDAYAGYREDGKNPSGHANLKIPEGYQAIKAFVQGVFDPNDHPEEFPAQLNILVGTKLAVITDEKKKNGPPPLGLRQELDLSLKEDSKGGYKEAQSLPVAYDSYYLEDYAATVDVLCERTDATLEEWKVKTHAAIIQAYLEQLRNYEEKLAARTFQQSAQGRLGGNPDQNRRIERTEIKKACIAILSGYDLTQFDGIDEENPPSAPLPEPKPPKKHFPLPRVKPWQSVPSPSEEQSTQKQGRIVRFFEQAFEWEQMTYFFYPYYWGRKKTWYDKVLKENDDPLFADFLNAGEARVVIPVRPTFNASLLYFSMVGGEIWEGGELPNIADTNYLPITEEIKESTGAPGKETPQGEPWKIKLPTQLIKLRTDGKRPGWERKDPKGWDWEPGSQDWEPVPEDSGNS